jgi:hypothetical protein
MRPTRLSSLIGAVLPLVVAACGACAASPRAGTPDSSAETGGPPELPAPDAAAPDAAIDVDVPDPLAPDAGADSSPTPDAGTFDPTNIDRYVTVTGDQICGVSVAIRSQVFWVLYAIRVGTRSEVRLMNLFRGVTPVSWVIAESSTASLCVSRASLVVGGPSTYAVAWFNGVDAVETAAVTADGTIHSRGITPTAMGTARPFTDANMDLSLSVGRFYVAFEATMSSARVVRRVTFDHAAVADPPGGEAPVLDDTTYALPPTAGEVVLATRGALYASTVAGAAEEMAFHAFGASGWGETVALTGVPPAARPLSDVTSRIGVSARLVRIASGGPSQSVWSVTGTTASLVAQDTAWMPTDAIGAEFAQSVNGDSGTLWAGHDGRMSNSTLFWKRDADPTDSRCRVFRAVDDRVSLRAIAYAQTGGRQKVIAFIGRVNGETATETLYLRLMEDGEGPCR